MEKLVVGDWMNKHVVTISPDTTLIDARKLLHQHRIRRLPVVDENECLIGMVTEGDIREAWPSDMLSLLFDQHYMLGKLTVDGIMTRRPVTVAPDTSIKEAALLMLDKKIGGLPVVEGNKLVGIITESDVFRVIAHKI